MKKVFKFSAIFIVGIVLLVYIAGFYYFGRYFLPNSKVNDKDVSFTKISDLYNTYNSTYDNFELEIVGRGVKDKVKAASFDYKNILEPNQVVNQNPFYWVFYLFNQKEYNLESRVTYDKEKFEGIVNNLNLVKEKTIEPENAKVVFNGKKFEIEKEVLGNKLKKDLLIEKILDYISEDKDTLKLEDEGIYYNPTVYSNDVGLKSKLDQMNKLNSFEITYKFEDRTEVIKDEELLNMYRENEDGLLVPDTEKVTAYVRSLEKKYDTFHGTRNFYATGIGPIVVKGGIYGWWTDTKATVEQLTKALENTETVTLEPIYKLTAQSRSANDLGNSYIEVDLGRQHLWMYKEGALVLETDFVSGNPNKGNGTPTGTDKIWSREKGRYLTGEDYKSFVDYWLAINWSNIGLHDASWRSQFGGSLYLSNGSHGCINIKPDVMKNIYDNSFVGMGVVVYDSSVPS